MWRTRWYLYAILLYVKEYFHFEIFFDVLVNQQLDDDTKKELRTDWKDIKKHVELSKMYKFSK